jgi:cysteine desulfurase / selenocysteine lyase
MTTSNPQPESPWGSLAPDPAVLAQLANEFFKAIPGHPATPSAASFLSGQPPVPSVVSTPSPALAAPSPVPGGPSGALASGQPFTPAQLPLNPVPGSWGPESLAAIPSGLGVTPFHVRQPEEPKSSPFAAPALPSGKDNRAFSFPAVFPESSTGSVDPAVKGPGVAGATPPITASVPVESFPELPPGAGTGGFPGTASNGTKKFSAEKDLPAFDAFTFMPVVAPSPADGSKPGFDAAWYKRDFPILQQKINGKPLVWLDNAATTQKPQAVIDRLEYFYANENSNVHRAAHTLAARSTDAYEGAREKVRRFLGASSAKEIVFVRGATEAINLVAKAWGEQNIGEGDEIIVSWLEHHANIVPWQQLASANGAKLRVIPVDDSGQVLLDEYEKLFNSKTKLVSVTQVSNALGTVVPVREMVQVAHRHGAKILVDGAQAVSHLRVNVAELDSDFYVFSGHKIFAPTGIGVLYGKEALLNSFQPWQGGGNMIVDVTFEKTVYQSAPGRFEAGTGNIADAVGLGAALDYLDRVGMENIARYEHELLVYGTQKLKNVPGLRIIGTAPDKAGVLSFVIGGFKNEDIGKGLDQEGIAVRSGHHCAQPILRRFGLEGTVRASLAFYNTFEDLDALESALCRLVGARVPAAR